MNWRCKALLQSALAHLPAGESAHFLLQKWVTRSQPPGRAEFVDSVEMARAHLDAFHRQTGRSLADATFYEFGAGWGLTNPLAFYAFGVDRQIVVDIRRLARREVVLAVMRWFHETDLEPSPPRKPQAFAPRTRDWMAHVAREFGIDYRAPCDARATGLPDGCIDCITSTATLEHIPMNDLTSILRECHRLLRSGGVMSHFIDYGDHYAYFDGRISRYNFLRYSDVGWQRYSSPLLYQNRLRHRDYLELFEATGFVIAEEHPTAGSDADRDTVSRLPVDSRFEGYHPEELAVHNSLVVLRKG